MPVQIRGDLEVASALSFRAFQSGHLDLAVRAAEDALASAPDNPLLMDQVASMLLEQQRHQGRVTSDGQFIAQSATSLERALGLYTAALKAPSLSKRPAVRGAIHRRRALVYRMLGEQAAAEDDVQKAHVLAPDDLEGTVQYAIMLERQGRIDDAIAALKGVEGTAHLVRVTLLLAELHRSQATAEGDTEFEKLLMKVIDGPSDTDSEARVDASALLAEHYGRHDRHEESQRLVEHVQGRVPDEAWHVLHGQVQLARGDVEAAGVSADAAGNALSEDSSNDSVLRVARLLHRLQRYDAAFNAWARIITPYHGGVDTNALLEAAARSGREQFVLDFCRQLRGNGVNDPGCTRIEVSVLVAYHAYSRAIETLQEQLERSPQDKVMRLALSELGILADRADIIESRLDQLPAVETIDPRIGASVVRVLKNGDSPQSAWEYAYALIRRAPDSAASYSALEMALLPIGGPDVELSAYTEVVPGTAVCLRLPSGETSQWYVLEEAVPPMARLNEVGPGNPITAQLRGRRVGDLVQLRPHAPHEPQFEVVEILHKAVYRLREWFSSAEALYPTEVHFRSLTIPHNEAGEVDVDALRQQIEAVTGVSAERRSTVEKLYQDAILPIHLFARGLNLSLVRATLYILASRHLQLKYTTGGLDAHRDAVALLATTPGLVLDTTAVVTLAVLGIAERLTDLGLKLIVSAGTLDELRTLIDPPPDDDAQKRQIADLLITVRTCCIVEDGLALLELDPEVHAFLDDNVGRATAEALVLAQRHGMPLWTDDLAVAEIAGTSLGVVRVWTDIVLAQLHATGAINDEQRDRTLVAMHYYGYQVTPLTVSAILTAAEMASWDVSRPPLSGMFDYFSNPGARRESVATMSGQLLVGIWQRAALVHQRDSLTRRLLDALALYPEGPEFIKRLHRTCQERFGVDALNGLAAQETLKSWMQLRGWH